MSSKSPCFCLDIFLVFICSSCYPTVKTKYSSLGFLTLQEGSGMPIYLTSPSLKPYPILQSPLVSRHQDTLPNHLNWTESQLPRLQPYCVCGEGGRCGDGIKSTWKLFANCEAQYRYKGQYCLIFLALLFFYLLYMFNLSHSSATSTPAINWQLLLIRCFMLIHPSLEKKKKSTL